ncbi:MAG TPA: hybrid sensor histidine kinase/response regulator [Oculatellaceae cyanobacterium]|jgi:chemotaxis family two-component system sensor histidine kinase/response regulator PixL
MISDESIREQAYFYFQSEAPELLQVIEQEILTLLEDRSTAKIHNLMRAAHTMKGASANVGLEVIQTIAHSLEDVVKTLYNPELVIDAELQSLLLQGYECLREPLMLQLNGGTINKEEALNHSSAVFIKLEEKLGDFLSDPAQIPSSVELGFDVVQSIFEIGVQQRLENLSNAIAEAKSSAQPENSLSDIANLLRSEAEVFIGLAESFNLSGFGAIAQTTITALDAHPDQSLNIAEIALANFKEGQQQILSGDRTDGGTPSEALQQLAGISSEAGEIPVNSQNVETELEQFREFIISDRFNTHNKLHQKLSKFYLRVTRTCLGWFHHYENIPQSDLSLNLLVPQVLQQDTANQETAIQEAQTVAKYIDGWIGSFIDSIKDANDSPTLGLYQKAALLTVILAIAKFLYANQITNLADYRNLPLLQILERRLIKTVKEYKNSPPLSDIEKNWLEQPLINTFILEEHSLEFPDALTKEDTLIDEIWGSPSQSDNSSIELSTAEEVVPFTEKLKISEPNQTTNNLDQQREKHQVNHPTSPQQNTVKTGNQFVKVELEELEQINHLASNLLINQNRQIAQDENLQSAVNQLRVYLKQHQQTINKLRDWSNQLLTLPYQTNASKSNSVTALEQLLLPNMQLAQLDNKPPTAFDTLELDRYTEIYRLFITAIEETLQLETVTETIDQITKQFSHSLERQQRLLSHMRNDMTAVQMLPVGEIFGRFSRLVEQLAIAKNKPVELKFSGSQVLVDKAIAEKLYEPLLHLVRNAFDHGIEAPESRVEQGKPQTGQIEIRAYHQGNQTIIEVRDDGKGLNFDSIRQRAVELKFINSEQINQISKSQLLDLLFEPGFSTARTISDLSGRGIGLDIVRNQLQSLKGSITVESQPQMGTIFSLQIPFSLTSAKFFVCQAGNFNYALLSESIVKIVLAKSEQIQVWENKKVLLYEQGYANEKQNTVAIPVYQLSELIKYNYFAQYSSLINKKTAGIKPDQKTQTDNLQLFLLRGNTGLLALEIDQIIGEQELVIRPLGSAIATPNYIFGCSILGDGHLLLAIDGAVLLEQKFSANNQSNLLSASNVSSPALPAGTAKAVRELPPAVTFNPKTVLVVDDSLSHRQTLTLHLQKVGYQILQAQDGQEALEQLRKSSDISLVICDIEMPRMNGFEFLNHRTQDPALNKIPVMMLTSRNSEKHRLLALELGAAAYLTKPYLQQELLNTITNLIK